MMAEECDSELREGFLAYGIADRCIDEVCAVTGVTRRAMLSATSTRHVSRARQVAWWLIRETTGLSLKSIARVFGRDHTTVHHGIRVVGRQVRDIRSWPHDIFEQLADRAAEHG